MGTYNSLLLDGINSRIDIVLSDERNTEESVANTYRIKVSNVYCEDLANLLTSKVHQESTLLDLVR